MANVLTSLIPELYSSIDTVSRELTGFITSVNINSGVERAALNQSVRIPIAPAATVNDITPASTIPTTGDQTIGSTEITLTKSRAAAFQVTGEESLGLDSGVGVGSIQAKQIAQAFRAITSEIEADLASLYAKASRATGVSGTTAFVSNLSDPANLRKILTDNGSPSHDLQLVINSEAAVALRTLDIYNSADRAGSSSQVRNGELLNIHGFSIKESPEVDTHTKGTASSATTDNAGYSVGDTVITLASAGTGTLISGDSITLATTGDSNIYTVTSGSADVSAGGDITIAEPGLIVAIPASAKAISVEATHVSNMGFDRNAIVLAIRPPALPEGGDIASDRILIPDIHTGLVFDVAEYKAYHQSHFEVSASWGFEMAKSEHAAILLG